MTIRHFRIFIAVATTESITKAAAQLYLSQPTVSVAIRELEDHYGTKFFERINQRLKITDDGKMLLGYVTHIIDLCDDMEKEFQNPDVHGNLRVGASVTVGMCQLPELVRQFQDLYPDVRVQVQVDRSDVIEQGLLGNDLDLALIEGAVRDHNLKAQLLFRQNHVAVCAPEHRFAALASVTLEEFVKEPILFRMKNSPATEVFSAHLLRAGYNAVPVWRSSTLEAIRQAAKCGLGVAVLPERMVAEDIRAGLLCKLELMDFEMKSKVFLACYKNKYISAAMERFTDMLQENWPDFEDAPEED